MSENGQAGQRTLTKRQIKIYLLLGLGLVHVLVTLFFIVPGYLLIDEVIYHWMSLGLARGEGFEIWNGYNEFPSLELYHQFIPPRGGRLVSQYPYLFTILAYPLNRVFGFLGLFILNSISFVGVVAFCFLTARKLFRDEDLALNACLILVGATFAWEYSQAAWPHAAAMLFISGAFYLCVSSYFDERRREALIKAAAAGLIAGFGPAVRMDSILVFPAILMPFLFARPWRPLEALAVCLGSIPGLVALAAMNYMKFGQFTPLSYGHKEALPVALLVCGVGPVLAAWVLTRSFCADFVHRRRIAMLLAAVIAAVALALIPQTRTVLEKVATSAYVSVIDIRSLDSNLTRPAMTRSSGGGVVYLGAQKKALLQSLPFLAMLLIPVLRIAREDKDMPSLAMLFVMPLTMIAYYSYTFFDQGAFEGGLCINYRYYLPILPFLAILCAYSVKEIAIRWGEPLDIRVAGVLACVTAAGYFILVDKLSENVNDLEFPLLVVPLLLAAFLFVLLLVGELMKPEDLRVLRTTVWAGVIVTLVWASSVAFFYDYPRHRNQRVVNYNMGESLRKVVAEDSIFFTAPTIDPYMRVIENHRVRIALPIADGFKDFPALVRFHLNAGRHVYAAFPDYWWQQLKSGPLAHYVVIPRLVPHPGNTVAEIFRPKKAESGNGK